MTTRNGRPLPTIDLRPDPREHVQTVLAKCYVAMSEADYDLARWREVVENPMRVIDLRKPAWVVRPTIDVPARGGLL